MSDHADTIRCDENPNWVPRSLYLDAVAERRQAIDALRFYANEDSPWPWIVARDALVKLGEKP